MFTQPLVAQIQVPQNAVWYDAVQIVMLIACLFGIGILVRLAFSHEKRLVALETTVGNHHKSRLERVRKELGIEWQGCEKDED